MTLKTILSRLPHFGERSGGGGGGRTKKWRKSERKKGKEDGKWAIKGKGGRVRKRGMAERGVRTRRGQTATALFSSQNKARKCE